MTTSVDGIAGPYAGSYMLQCNYQTDGNWPTVLLSTSDYSDELFLRLWVRMDSDVNRTGGYQDQPTVGQAAFKLLRYFENGSPYHDLFPVAGHPQDGWNICWNANDSDGACVYDQGTINTAAAWHEFEIYIHQSSGIIRSWVDGAIALDISGYDFGGRKWTSFNMQSNGNAGVSDNSNHWYVDEFEVYTDHGSGGSGLMADATITQGAGPGSPPSAPSNLQVS